MIVATKDGWLIASELVNETEQDVEVRFFDDGTNKKIKKTDTETKVFSSIKEAVDWIGRVNAKAEGVSA